MPSQSTTRPEWRDIEGFPGWGVNEYGEVINDWTSRTMTVGYNQQGIATVRLQKEKRQYARSVALLVANAFLEPPVNSAFDSVIHLNGDKTDCRASNLMWRPRWFVINYHRMFDQEPKRVAVYIPELDRTFGSLRDFCITYGLIEHTTYISMLNQEPCFLYGWIVERLEP